MREIKFRAWDGKKMHLPEYSEREDFHIQCDGVIVETHEHGYERHELTTRRGPEWVLMQYTGLKDKHGKDIYEGDLIRVNLGATATYEVRFENGEYCLYNFQFKELGKWGSIGSLHSACDLLKTDFEIIGNIHQVKQ